MKIDNNLDESRLEGVPGMSVAPGPGTNTYTVLGAGNPHVVMLDYATDSCSCDCADFGHRGVACRHIIAARWFCNDPYVVGKLGPVPPQMAAGRPPTPKIEPVETVATSGALRNDVTNAGHWFYPVAQAMAAEVCAIARAQTDAAPILQAMIADGRIHVRYRDPQNEPAGFAIAFEESDPAATDAALFAQQDQVRRNAIDQIFAYAVANLKGGAFADRFRVYRTLTWKELGPQEKDDVWSANRKHKLEVEKLVVGVEFAVNPHYQAALPQ